MKRLLPFFVLALAVVFVASTFVAHRAKSPFDIARFGRLPVVVNGRVKPLDTVARTALLVIQGRQRVVTPDHRTLSPDEWLLDMCFIPERADDYRIFKIVQPDVLALFHLTPEDGDAKVRFAYNQFSKDLAELDRQAQLAQPVEAQARTSFQRAVVQLQSDVQLYQRLRYSLVSPESPDFLSELMTLQDHLEAGVAAVRAKQAGQAHDEALAQATMATGEHFMHMSQAAYLFAVPPPEGEGHPAGWKNTGAALLETFETGRVNPYVMTYAGLARTWHNGNAEQFNHIVTLYRSQLEKALPQTLRKTDLEARFNGAEPFLTSSYLYVFAFLFAIVSWLAWPDVLGRSALWLIGIAWLLATAGIAARMWIEGRPPVTNLYSSALFIGWAAVALCLVLEIIYKNAIGSAAAGLIGFGTLLIAHHLSLDGDTMEMMRAVLDSNFWLATHVVTVTIGYSATFLSGLLAIIYIVRGVFTKSLDKATADALARMVYGIVCFATLFSFVGTVLGGIWADQSWGRFWGWDPKENGALIIVVWNAIILHARWGGMVRQRGLMALAVFGNIVTSWSWFGTNMLGIGLHSYGFTQAAFWALSIFIASQLVLIVVANVPLDKWRSFRAEAPRVPPPPRENPAPLAG